MDPRLAQILALATRSVPGTEATVELIRARRVEAGGDPDDASAPLARSYELVLDAGTSWEAFVGEAVPRLVYHLDSLGVRPPALRGVVLGVFAGDRLHLLPLRACLEAVGLAQELTPEQLFLQHGTGESRTARRGPPA